MYYAGIDIGSLSTDAMVIKDDHICGFGVVPTLADGEAAAVKALNIALEMCGIDRNSIESITATGYGRSSLSFADRTVTEITCHAIGARKLFPDASCVIDVGGQDSKVIRLSADGKVEDFLMNDKCAAGTGRFLEVMAKALDTHVTDLASLEKNDTGDIRITSTCTVFAESEVVALVASGTPRECIIGGLHRSVADRIAGMVARLNARPPFIMTGGVAKNSGIVKALEKRLASVVVVPEEPQIVGALGAALLASRGFI